MSCIFECQLFNFDQLHLNRSNHYTALNLNTRFCLWRRFRFFLFCNFKWQSAFFWVHHFLKLTYFCSNTLIYPPFVHLIPMTPNSELKLEFFSVNFCIRSRLHLFIFLYIYFLLDFAFISLVSVFFRFRSTTQPPKIVWFDLIAWRCTWSCIWTIQWIVILILC